MQQGGHGQHLVLRGRDEAQGGEAPPVVGLTPRIVVGRPLLRDATGLLVAGEPAALGLAGGRIATVRRLAAGERPSTDALGDPDALLLPALADPHLHVVACAADRAGVDLAPDRPRSIRELCARLAAAARRLPAGTWLRASGHDEAWLAERRHPTVAELDAAVPRHPLRLRHATRHASLLNTPARRRAEHELGALPACDDGGAAVIGLEPELTRIVGPLEPGLLDAALARVGRALADCGVVALDDVTASNDASRIRVLAQAVARGALPQRVRAYVGDADEVAAARRAADHVQVVGVKLLARSADEARATALRDAVVRARRCGVPLAVHAVEADVADAVLDAFADAPPRAGGLAPPRDRLEHCSLCPPELARRIAHAGVAVVTQPAFLAARGVKYAHEVEETLWPWLYPLRTMLSAGVLVAASSDAPVAPLDPWLGLDGATRRRSADGDTVLGAEERISLAEALDLFTSAPARLHGLEDARRWPRPGAPADLLVAEGAMARDGWRRPRVRYTLSGGRVIGGADA